MAKKPNKKKPVKKPAKKAARTKPGTKKTATKKASKKTTAAKAVHWAAPRKGDWDFDPKTDPEWMDPSKPRLRIETDEQYRLVADCVVRGMELKVGDCEIVNQRGDVVAAVIDDLRKLVDAVQAHKEVRLIRAAKYVLLTTRLALSDCTIVRCDLSNLEIGINLVIRSHFQGWASFQSSCFETDASFESARFNGPAWFHSARFKDWASFRSARFMGRGEFGSARFEGLASFDSVIFKTEASFQSACFEDRASFQSACFKSSAMFYAASFEDKASFGEVSFKDWASFHYTNYEKEAWFSWANFQGEALFQSASFRGTALFYSASFKGPALFYSASFRGLASFAGASISRQLTLAGVEIEHRLSLGGHGIEDAVFGPNASLKLNNIIPRSGSSIELSKEQLLRQETQEHTLRRLECLGLKSNQPWAIRTKFVVGLLRRLTPTGSILGLGLGSRHNLIEGESLDQWVYSDTDPLRNKPTPLDEATRSYNLLRDVFRSQPSTDELEDICTIRHQDLLRRSWDDGTRLSKLKMFFHWLVMRNMLGYLIVPMRIIMTSVLLVLTFGLVYAVFASDATVHFSGDQAAPWDQSLLDRALFGLYFSLTTFVTLGYGDYAPTGLFKLLTGAEAFVGVALLALFTVAWGRKMIR